MEASTSPPLPSPLLALLFHPPPFTASPPPLTRPLLLSGKPPRPTSCRARQPLFPLPFSSVPPKLPRFGGGCGRGTDVCLAGAPRSRPGPWTAESRRAHMGRPGQASGARPRELPWAALGAWPGEGGAGPFGGYGYVGRTGQETWRGVAGCQGRRWLLLRKLPLAYMLRTLCT
ncbi:hypothetical protein BDY21DRAFT_344761 [Lineolata rhizophorae]|uniref:Uncharacterized protein n=1 Tax=Lineolata rhizophorae TaxID=578093 RepID=A0A6A6NZT8_9PEZI|nr:hypothetical protein BDY21DRAFT_344761 [Lineolata rhizophorae]